MKKCPNCGKKVVGHPNKRFCRSKCKDRFHNTNNPRGYFAHLNPSHPEYVVDEGPEGWDGHKDQHGTGR
jgi:hypothetical protein